MPSDLQIRRTNTQVICWDVTFRKTPLLVQTIKEPSNTWACTARYLQHFAYVRGAKDPLSAIEAAFASIEEKLS